MSLKVGKMEKRYAYDFNNVCHFAAFWPQTGLILLKYWFA